jgi:nicotinamidase-related amidase
MLPSAAALERLIEEVDGLSRVASGRGTLIVHVRRKPAMAARIFGGQIARGSEAESVARSAGRIDVVSDCFFMRTSADAFSNGMLDRTLRENGIGHLFIVGMDNGASIRQTALSALKMGYRVSFIRDGIFSTSEKRWQRALTTFESAAAFAITSGEFRELAMTAFSASEGQQCRPHALGPETVSNAIGAIRSVTVAGIRHRPVRDIALVAASLVMGFAGSWWYASTFSVGAETAAAPLLAATARPEPAGDNQKVIDGLRQVLEQQRARVESLTHDLALAQRSAEIATAATRKDTQAKEAAERSAMETRQMLESEQARTTALTRDLEAARGEIEAARGEIEARTTAASAATAEAAQEHERAEALTRELEAARGETAMLRTAATRSAEQVAQLEQEAARAVEAHRQALQHERDEAGKLDRELVAARQELAAGKSQKVEEQAAWGSQIAELRHTLEQSQASAAASQEALAREQARRQPADRKTATVSPTTTVAAASHADSAVSASWPSSAETGTDAEISHLMTRADLLLIQGDVAAARVVLDRAAETGNARALFTLAETYDPSMLSGWGTLGTRGDAAKARELYARALSGGVQEAKDRLEALH